jgi:hypothetical protein
MSVLVGVEIPRAAATDLRCLLVRVLGAAVQAVEHTVAVPIDLGRTTATGTRNQLVGVLGAEVEAVGGLSRLARRVGIFVRDATAAEAGVDRLEGVGNAHVQTVGRAIFIGVVLRRATPALPR